MKILGSTVDVQVASADNESGSYVFTITVPEGDGIPPHVHQNEDEVVCVLEGSFEITLGEATEVAGEGKVCNFPRGVVHGFRNLEAADSKVLVFVSPGAGFERFFGELSVLSSQEEIDMGEVAALAGRYGMAFV